MLNVFAGTPTFSAASLNVGVREEALCACSILMTLSAEFFWHSDPKAGRLNCFLLDARGPVYQARLSPHLPNSSPFMGFRSILFGAARAVRTSGGRLPWRESGFPPVEKKNTLPMQSAAFTRHSNCTQRSKLQPGRSTREAAARAFCLTPKGPCRAGDVIDQVDTCVILITCAGLCPTLHKHQPNHTSQPSQKFHMPRILLISTRIYPLGMHFSFWPRTRPAIERQATLAPHFQPSPA